MSKTLVFTEFSKDHAKSVTLEILGKMKGVKPDVVAIGDFPTSAKEDLAKYGAENIHVLKGDALKNYSPEGYAQAIHDLIKANGYEYIFAGSTSIGKDLFPRLSSMFNSGMISEVTNFSYDGSTFSGTRPLFAGKCLAKVEFTGAAPHFITVRPNALGLDASPTAGAGNVSEANASVSEIKALIKEIVKGTSEKLDLTEANIIVSGGRAMKNSENFSILNQLADVLGATVGASRAAVDAGYAPHNMQVGQTGKTVSPSLYIACGISGAIQHLAGMRTSKVIVAINTDPDAPIFTKADYGIVGDLFKVVPILTQEFKNLLGK
ncbi:MAG: electron transfer flavoprotein subunit alpha [Bdellovibrio sp. CG12_big_fil_rev_8_21_14_0_65_39_13]|nr:MAG: electron transfer flavoprotein subunit alpha [Bdellovibrio sp. CG22_combo_CG10-13_8_21_14_all_39_27]PIQ60699.1 MAG: electron transfer flavoprotein subunit alpha [Bdellovibrio sp. CG12_big_fil_rev_8_21_14_0_65_39_13]PIR37083.1 MAG: electron transfer flavoprotein subunit alpha [Bdellovibrio sp. CG11_big_fil_rev_8_21_14_0_20_39_38]PJB53452.1 MAG: electron transfer flavoprotein subunit alpha/FixB family protein [Bdellovibrio sp. CG_4_9_14_3_um_filter_39_7]